MTRTAPRSAGLAFLVAFAIGSDLGASAVEAATTLRWKFREGETLRYQTDQKTSTKGKDPDGKEITQGLTLTIDLAWAVKAVEPSGAATITQTVDRIRTTATLPFGKVSFDSKESGDAAGPAGPIFKMMVGSEVTFRMTPRGEIVDVKLSDKLMAALKGDEVAGAQGQFSEVGLKNMVMQMGLILPEEGLDPGGTWNRKLAIPAGPSGQTRDVDQTFTYRGPDPASPSKAEGIDLSTGFEPIKPDPNVPISVKSEQARGRYQFDNVAGRIESSTLTQNVEVVGQIEGKDLAMTTETVTTMTLAKDRPTP